MYGITLATCKCVRTCFALLVYAHENCVYLGTYLLTYIIIYACMYVCMYVVKYVCMYICMDDS